MSRKSSRHLVFVVFLLTSILGCVLSCGQPRVTAPLNKNLQVPEFNNFGTLNLTSFDLRTTVFNGSMVIFNNAIQVDEVTRLLQASNAYHQSRIARNSYFSEFEKVEIAPRREAISRVQADLNVLQEQGNSKVLQLRSSAALRWLTNEADALAQKVSGLNPQAVSKVLNYYCEAKLWDFALSPASFEKTYKQRPTPAAICEGIYAANVDAQFFSDPSCNPNPAGQSYAKCIWNAGLKRTSYYKNSFLKGDVPGENGSEGPIHEKFWALVNDPVFEATLTVGPPAGSDCDAGLRTRILQASKPKPTNTNNLCNGTKYDFANKLPVGVAKNTTPESSTLQNIINAMEGREAANRNIDLTTPGAYANFLRLVPVQKDDGSASTQAELDLEYSLRQKISNFMSPQSGCGKVFRTSNDILFNGLMTARLLGEPDLCALPDLEKTKLPEILPQDSSVLAKKNELDKLLLDFNLDRGSACVPATGCSGQPESHVACKWLRTFEAKTSAVNGLAGVEILVKELRLVPKQDETGSTSLELLFDNEVAGYFCLGSVQNPQAPCVATLTEKESAAMDLNFDGATGHLVLTLPLTAKALAATAHVPNLGFGPYVSKTLKLDMYANSYNEKASYFSGKALILDGQNQIAQGQASYLMNETDDEPVKRFCANPNK